MLLRLIQCDIRAKRTLVLVTGRRAGDAETLKCLMNDFMDLTFVSVCIYILSGLKMIREGAPVWDAAQTLHELSFLCGDHMQPQLQITHSAHMLDTQTSNHRTEFVSLCFALNGWSSISFKRSGPSYGVIHCACPPPISSTWFLN